jgi:hypothetical protein
MSNKTILRDKYRGTVLPASIEWQQKDSKVKEKESNSFKNGVVPDTPDSDIGDDAIAEQSHLIR